MLLKIKHTLVEEITVDLGGNTKAGKDLFLTEEEMYQDTVIEGFQIEVTVMTEEVIDHGEEIDPRVIIEEG